MLLLFLNMRISMPRGDIRLVRFIINDPDGKPTDIDFTEIYFTVKKTANDKQYQFQKKLSDYGITKLGNGDYQVKIEPADTGNMAYGDYKFDVQILFENQIKETFVGTFILTEEITFNENE